MAKPVTWIVVADAGRARIFEDTGKLDARLGEERHSLTAATPPSREIASDRPGRAFDSAGEGRHAMEPPTDPLRHAKKEFARELVHTLDDARKQGDFDGLVIAAAPAFLGDIRSFMPEPLRACVQHEIDKDFTNLPDPELQRHIRQHL